MSDDKPTHTADELRLCADDLMVSVIKMVERGQVTKITYDKAIQPAVLLRAGADAIKRVKALEEALKQGADWFDEYAAMHEAKGATDKAARNKERAEHLRAALEKKP
jgi:hypothetical protein